MMPVFGAGRLVGYQLTFGRSRNEVETGQSADRWWGSGKKRTKQGPAIKQT